MGLPKDNMFFGFADKLTEEQLKYIDSIYSNQITFVNAKAGTGKCITGDSLIYTDKGILPIKDIPKHYKVNENHEVKAGIVSYTEEGERVLTETSHWYNMGNQLTKHVTLSSGLEIEGTHEHPLLVMTKEGNLEYRRLDKIKEGDFVSVSKNNKIFPDTDHMTTDTAYLLGLLIADAYLPENLQRISFSNSEEVIYNEFYRILETDHDFDTSVIRVHSKIQGKSKDHILGRSKFIKSFYEKTSLSPGLSKYKKVPPLVLQSGKGVQKAFIQGMFDTEASVGKGNIELTSASKQIADTLQVMLLNFGIRSSKKLKKAKSYPDNTYYRLSISGNGLRKFNEEIKFRNHDKYNNQLNYLCQKTNNSNKEVYPHQSTRFQRISENFFEGSSSVGGKNIRDQLIGRRNPSAVTVKYITSHVDGEHRDVTFLNNVSDNLLFEKVDSITDSEAEVFDFTVPDTHSFVANGIVNHNTFIAVAVAKLLGKPLLYTFSPVEEGVMGFTPGSQEEKESKYLRALLDALEDINEDPRFAIYREDNPPLINNNAWVTAKSHVFLRGSNIRGSTLIIDEAANFTTAELKKVLTRVHSDTKVIVIGHDKQCDLKNVNSSGFVPYIEHFKEKPYAGVITLTRNFRSELAEWADEL